jgi:hypothetical protein
VLDGLEGAGQPQRGVELLVEAARGGMLVGEGQLTVAR